MNKIMFLRIIGIFLLFAATPLQAFPKNSLRPGGVAILDVAPSSADKPIVKYENKPVAVVKGSQNWLAIVGISLNAKRGKHTVAIIKKNSVPQYKSFAVKSHRYKTQYLTIKNKNKVNPNKKSMQRIEREYLLKKRLKHKFTATPPKLNFIKPVPGRDSGRFGLRRVINKQKRNPHSGMDIAAAEGVPVKATETGRVIFVGDLFFSGNVIFLDHGNGLISLYAHLSKMNVKKGQMIKRGQVIGKVGKTGRVTGAHLHWSVFLNGNTVDPALFITGNQ